MALEKFNWQNGSQVEPAKVEIEGVSYDVVDAQYEGETPLSAANLNLMQDTLLSNVVDTTDDDTKIASVKLATPVSGNSGDNNYIKYPDGTLICYGLCPSTDTGHNKTSTASVTFAETFISQPSINLTIRASNDQSAQYLFCAVKSEDNLTGFTFRTRNSNTASSGAEYSARVYYQAIGRWK